jgi:hypothetical protein
MREPHYKKPPICIEGSVVSLSRQYLLIFNLIMDEAGVVPIKVPR